MQIRTPATDVPFNLHMNAMRLALLITLFGLALICAAAATAAPTRAEFIRKGDATCAQTQRALLPLRTRAQAAKTLPTELKWRATTDIWADQIAIQRRFVTRFRAIGTPAGDRAARGLVSGLARGVTLAENVRRGFAQRDTTRLSRALPAYLSFTVGLSQRVAAYGFHVCGR